MSGRFRADYSIKRRLYYSLYTLLLAALSLQPLAAPAQRLDDDVAIKTLAPLDSTPAKLYTIPSKSPAPIQDQNNSPATAAAPAYSPSAAPSPAGQSGRSSDKGASLSFTREDGAAADSAAPPLRALPSQPANVGAVHPLQSSSTTGGAGLTGTADGSTGQKPPGDGSVSLPLSENEVRQLAQKLGSQSQSQTVSSSHRPGVIGIIGTVQIRKPFKLFATEQLIHNLSFRDTPVKEVIAEIARRGNLNILIDKSVSGKITGELRDVTLNEAMDSVLAAAGLQHRTLDNNTVIVASLQAIVQLGLNRPMARVFKLSYAHPYDVAMILHASVFNKGMIPDFNKTARSESQTDTSTDTRSDRKTVGGGPEAQGNAATQEQISSEEGPNKESDVLSDTQTNRPDMPRTIRGVSRSQTQEGVGFNNAATDPGSQQIRSFQEINTDYIVEQNGGGAVVIPDTKNKQVMVVGTAEDLQIAEEAIRMLDRRPRQVHIQASMIELNNQAVRQLGAVLNVQGMGASTSILGNGAAPLIGFLPGLGSSFQNGTPPGVPFGANVTPGTGGGAGVPGNAFTGLIGTLLSTAPPTIANVLPTVASQTGFNFLTLSRAAGGNSNIATYPAGLNVNINMLLQTNKAKVVANPSVIVTDDTESLITIASEVVHKVTSTVSLGVVTTNVELTKAGIFLNVLPRITEDGFIIMRLRPQVSAPTGPPQIFGNPLSPTAIVTLLNVREVMSQEVRVKDGQTLVIGGLFTEQEASQLAKVPYLAETPVLGALFRNTLKGRNRTELMLLLTPKIVEDDPNQGLAEMGSANPM